MAGYRFLDLVTDIEALTNLTSQRALIKRLINQSVAKIAGSWDWPFLWTWDFFSTVAPYEDSTVTVTNGSPTVTGAVTVFTAAMVGRKFRVGNENAYYTILSRTSNTVITLDQNYQGSTQAGASYSVYQDEYLLRADVDHAKLLRQIENGTVLLSKNISDFDRAYPTPISQSSPTIEALVGRERDTYATGTITGATRTLTGSGTSWTSVRGLSRGTKIRIADVLYTVDTVDSATQITTYESMGTIAGGTAYTALIDNLIVLVHPIPDAAENIYYRFQRIPAVMDRDGDAPELPVQLHHLIFTDVMTFSWIHRGFPDRAQQARQLFADDLKWAISRYGHSNPDRTYQRQSSDLVHTSTLRYPTLNG